MAKKELTHSADNSAPEKKMNTKDLIYAGAFGAIYIALMLIIVMGSSVIPILYLLSPLTVGIVCGTVYELCVLKVRKFGAALILGALFALIASANYIAGMVMALVTSLLAELVIMAGKYRSKKMYLLSFVVFNLNMACPFALLFFAKDEFIRMSASYSGQAHADSLAALTPDWIFFAIIGLALLGGVIGALLSSKLIAKHFAKSGIV